MNYEFFDKGLQSGHMSFVSFRLSCRRMKHAVGWGWSLISGKKLKVTIGRGRAVLKNVDKQMAFCGGGLDCWSQL